MVAARLERPSGFVGNDFSYRSDGLTSESSLLDFDSIATRAAAEAGLDVETARLLAGLFHPGFYRRHFADRAAGRSPSELFDHYLKHGLAENYAPGPFFDPELCVEILAETGEIAIGREVASETPNQTAATAPSLLLRWVAAGGIRIGSPTRFFDPGRYLEINTDVASAGLDPFHHFIVYGQREARVSHSNTTRLHASMKLRSNFSRTPLADLFSLFSSTSSDRVSGDAIWGDLMNLLDCDFYRSQVPSLAGATNDDCRNHFIAEGIFLDARPSVLFRQDFYRRAVDLHLVDGPRSDLPRLAPTGNSIAHFLEFGIPARVVPTSLFDEDFYRQRYKDISERDVWGFAHYLKIGIDDLNRQPSQFFTPSYYAAQRGASQRYTRAITDYALEGEAAGMSPAPGIQFGRGMSSGVGDELRLEALVRKVSEKVARLSSAKMRSLAAKAIAIEPMVARPYGPRLVQWPPIIHAGGARSAAAGEDIRRRLRSATYDAAVLIPHCRMAGSARVAGAFLQAAQAVRPDWRILLVATDRSEFERPDWFGAEIDLVDISGDVQHLSAGARSAVLLDLVRGIGARHVVNINSRLGWDLYSAYGRQLSTWTRLHAYLFTWDLDRHGNKGGYPIQWFTQTFDHLTSVLIDNAPLAAELNERFMMTPLQRDRLRVAHTPAAPSEGNFSDQFERRRRAGEPLRAFWSGRFDRQKRFDVVIELAKRMPALEICAWGAPVLGDMSFDPGAVPSNIRLMGTYADLDDLPLQTFDFFLYTSEWDGLPTILMDVGARGFPTVASRVGGVGDLIDEHSGWPVTEALHAEAYVTAIEEMCRQPAEVTRRAAAFRTHTAQVCDPQGYRAHVASILVEE